MVGVAHMRVGMLDLPVAVLMGMPEGAIGGKPLEILGCVIVLVMGIATAVLSSARIVPVAMGMQQRFVTMPVAVLLPQQQDHPGAHQPRRQQQGRGKGVPQNHNRKQRPHKRRGGEQHRLTGGPQIAQRQQVEPDGDAIAQGADAKQRQGHQRRRVGMTEQQGQEQHRHGSPRRLGGSDLDRIAQAEPLAEVVVDAPGQGGQGDQGGTQAIGGVERSLGEHHRPGDGQRRRDQPAPAQVLTAE